MAEVPAMSAFQQKSLEAKHDKILKELSRVAANRRCVDCDNIVRIINQLDYKVLGNPLLLVHLARAHAFFACSTGSAICYYIICRFRLHRVWRPSVSFPCFRQLPRPIFELELMCITSLLCSRQYGHRVKGISMSKFSKEEIAEIQTGGNEVRN